MLCAAFLVFERGLAIHAQVFRQRDVLHACVLGDGPAQVRNDAEHPMIHPPAMDGSAPASRCAVAGWLVPPIHSSVSKANRIAS